MDDLVNFGVDDAAGVHQLHAVGAVQLGFRLKPLLDLLQFGILQLEGCRQGAAAGLAEADGGGLVPHHVARPQALDEHEHVDGVHRPVEAAAEDTPHIVVGAQRKPQLHAHCFPVPGDVGDAPAGPAIAGPEVHGPAEPSRAPGFTHHQASRCLRG